MHFTERLRIEPLTAAHAAAMLPVLSDERLYRYMPAQRHDTVESLAARYRRLEAGPADPDERWLNACLFRIDTGAAIGYVQATVLRRARVALVAYVLAPGHWGHGYANEGLRWLLGHLAAGGEVDVARAQIDDRNAASIALVARASRPASSTSPEDGAVRAASHSGKREATTGISAKL